MMTMKHLCSFKHIAWTFLLFFGSITLSYAQQSGIPYQAYFVDNNAGYVFGEQIKNVPLANSKVLLSFEVRDENGQVEYIEHIEVPTDQYGMASTIVGVGIGTPQAGTQFSNVDWNGKKKMLHIDIDFSNSGNNFVDHGEMPIIDIPGPAEDATTGLTTAVGPPTTTNPADPNAGDLYVDEATGHVYTFNGTTNAWESQHETLTSLALETNDNGSPTDISDDYDQLVYTNENKVTNSIDIGALVKANNGLSVVAGTVELGGTLTKPTTITTSATNTLTITGLPEETAFSPNEDQVVVLDQPSGVIKRTSLAALSVQKEKVWVAANDGDTDFDTPLTITSIEKINVFRNGARVGFTAVDTDTIKLETEATCYKGDEIRIVQLQ